ncbi:MAG: RNase P modulator RnpM [Roseiflexaceae bacterium]
MTQHNKRPKHIPQRLCISCRTSTPKRGLVRIVRIAEGRIVVDTTGKLNGRGAYVCAEPQCWQNLFERNTLASALRLQSVTEEDRAILMSFARTIEAINVD